jgi:hypothetical protein
MNLRAVLPWCKARPLPLVLHADFADTEAVTPEDDAAPAFGCGWFDSSHELQHGLQVHEHAGVDTLGSELPLAVWLELQARSATRLS